MVNSCLKQKHYIVVCSFTYKCLKTFCCEVEACMVYKVVLVHFECKNSITNLTNNGNFYWHSKFSCPSSCWLLRF